jgi:hypothetical protein
MGLFTTWVYRKMHSGRFANDVVPAPAQVAPEFKPPQTPIELRPRIDLNEGNLGYGIGLLFLTIFLFTRDGTWLRLLAWPAGAVVLLFTGMFLYDAWNDLGTRFVADAAGLQIHDRSGMKNVPWSRVAKVKLMERFGSTGGGTSNFSSFKRLRSRSLELLDAHGASLLKLDLPLRSAEASKIFEASLPVWTNRAIEVEQVGK